MPVDVRQVETGYAAWQSLDETPIREDEGHLGMLELTRYALGRLMLNDQQKAKLFRIPGAHGIIRSLRDQVSVGNFHALAAAAAGDEHRRPFDGGVAVIESYDGMTWVLVTFDEGRQLDVPYVLAMHSEARGYAEILMKPADEERQSQQYLSPDKNPDHARLIDVMGDVDAIGHILPLD